MGHEDIQTTMIYVQFVPKKADQAIMQRARTLPRGITGSITAVEVARNLAVGVRSEV
jgi:hypothetical protein